MTRAVQMATQAVRYVKTHVAGAIDGRAGLDIRVRQAGDPCVQVPCYRDPTPIMDAHR